MSESKRIARVSASVLSREVQGEAILLHLDSGEYFGLDPVGARIWQLIGEKGDLELVAAAVCEEDHVDPALALRDLERVVSDLLERKLIEIDDARA